MEKVDKPSWYGDSKSQCDFELCIKGITLHSRKWSAPLLLALVKLPWEYYVEFWIFKYQKDVDKLEDIQKTATQIIKSLKGLIYEDSLWHD